MGLCPETHPSPLVKVELALTVQINLSAQQSLESGSLPAVPKARPSLAAHKGFVLPFLTCKYA